MPLSIEPLLTQLAEMCRPQCAHVSAASLVNCYEFEAFQLARLQQATDPEELAGLLTFLWTDLAYAPAKPSPLVHCAVYTTAQALVHSQSWQNPLSTVHGLCDRWVDAYCAVPALLDPQSEPHPTFAKLLTALVLKLQLIGDFCWLPLANACAAIWPEHTPELFGFLNVNHPAEWCALQYLSVLAYPQNAHPWLKSSVELWVRYGLNQVPPWPNTALQHLRERLAPGSVKTRLATLVALHIPHHPGLQTAEIVREIEQLQLDTDFPVRTQILLNHLASNADGLVWNDDWGIP